MTLTHEEIQEIKKQLSQQIQHLSPDKKSQAQQQIDSMSEEALESLLEQQKSKQPQKPLFRMIVDREIPSKIIDENRFALATLDIKPISQGHTIIIPKSPVEKAKDIPAQVFSLAKKIAKKLSLKLKSKSAEIQTEFKFGEIIINVIPIYEESLNINSPRSSPSDSELEEVYKKLRVIKKPKVQRIKIKKTQETKILKLNRRIP